MVQVLQLFILFIYLLEKKYVAIVEINTFKTRLAFLLVGLIVKAKMHIFFLSSLSKPSNLHSPWLSGSNRCGNQQTRLPCSETPPPVPHVRGNRTGHRALRHRNDHINEDDALRADLSPLLQEVLLQERSEGAPTPRSQKGRRQLLLRNIDSLVRKLQAERANLKFPRRKRKSIRKDQHVQAENHQGPPAGTGFAQIRR